MIHGIFKVVDLFPGGVVMNVFAKSSFFIFVVAAALLFPAVLSAEEKESADLLRYYNSELFQWNYSLFGGLTLNFQNQNASPMYGIKTPMKDALLRYPDSAKEYKTYRWKNTTGNVLFWGGFAVTLSMCFMPAFLDEKEWFEDSPNVRIAASVMLGGMLSELVGIFLMSASQEDIYSAVNVYNRNRIGDYQ
jgi:hypothetical protein